jgi:hypothetical protein
MATLFATMIYSFPWRYIYNTYPALDPPPCHPAQGGELARHATPDAPAARLALARGRGVRNPGLEC